MVFAKVRKKLKGLSGKQKLGLGIGAAAGAAAVGYGAYRLLKGGRRRRRGLTALRSKVEKTALKIKLMQLKRRLFKEQLKF